MALQRTALFNIFGHFVMRFQNEFHFISQIAHSVLFINESTSQAFAELIVTFNDWVAGLCVQGEYNVY